MKGNIQQRIGLRGTVLAAVSAPFLLASFATLGAARPDDNTPKDKAGSALLTKEQQEQATFFEAKVRPVLINNCFVCHGEKDQKGSLRLDSRDALLKGNAAGAVVVPGDPDKSRLIHAVRQDGPVKMPPTGKLNAAEIAALTEWVKKGAYWPKTIAKPTGASGTPDMVITAAQKNFWSFRPIRKPALPPVKNAAWCRTPIDRFILARLEKEGLKPAPAADRRTLIRRATFDLIGLPPTPEEVDAFVNDTSLNAWEKVIDRLLASPQYGERWGRRWLDLVRYADSNGLDENVAFAHAHRYRDYVISSFNKDKPYNVFLTEQLAGDLMPTTDPALRNERLTATGFLSLGAKLLAEPDKEKMVMDIVDEQIEVTSKAFLGLTVACARCHNHKFDPIPTKDYYALAGIFKSTKTMANLATVAMWEEKPLLTPELEAARKVHDQKVREAQDVLQRAKDQASAATLAAFRRDGTKYLQFGWELAQQGGLYSVAETPVRPGDPPRLIVEAEKFDRGNLMRDFEIYGRDIGVIYNIGTPDVAEWDVNIPAAGNYQVELRYASSEKRPVKLSLNGKVIRESVAGQITGSFQPDGQKWEVGGIFSFNEGKNTLRIDCETAIPHFDKILIVPVRSTSPGGRSFQTPEQIAGASGLNLELLKLSASNLINLKEDPAHLTEAARSQEIEAIAKRVADALKQKPEPLLAAAEKEAVNKAELAFKAVQASNPLIPMAMAVQEDSKIANCRVHIRGDTQSLGDEVPRHFLTVLGGDKEAADDKQSGRLQLAEWLTRPAHPLTSRVEINRLWQDHFGEGLVKTPDNWGFLGLQPTHPELLDWLASEFMRQDWSAKKMHRLIMLSSTYKMASVNDAKMTAKAELADPENRLLWRFNRRRLEAEPFRDALLRVSGRLDLTMGGTLLKTGNHDYVTNDQSGNAAQYNSPRRSIYLPIIRNALFDMFQAFDVGDPSMVNAKRASTTVAPQALFVMNSPFAIEQSRAFADSLLNETKANDTERIKTAYMKCFARPPAPAEYGRALSFLSAYETRLSSGEPDIQKRHARAWQSLCQILFASNEFIYVN